MRLAFILLMVVILAGCDNSAGPRPPEAKNLATKKQICVTNYPLLFFAERIAGGSVDVRFPMTDDGDPAFWQPSTEAIQQFQSADAILLNGATYEKWLSSATLPEARLHDTSEKFRDQFIEIKEAETHSHGPEGPHSHAGIVFTTWIDFDQARQQAAAVKETLVKLAPQQASELEKNYAALAADLQKLDEQMLAVGRLLGSRPLIASHPVYDYLARRYSLNLKCVVWEPDVVPADAEWEALKKLLDGHAASVMIWEGEPAQESRDRLRQMGIASVVFDPCGNQPETGDWLSHMRANVQSLRAWAESNK